MATSQHYLWAGGHFLLLVSFLRYFTAWITFSSASPVWYKAAYIGAVVSYAIVCLKSLGTPQPSPAFLKRAIVDENVQYLLLALFWFTSKPITISLLPFAIFSLFHALTFVRTTLLPQFLPPTPPATAGGQPTPHKFAKILQTWVKSNYDTAMRAVAYTELVILVRVLLGAVTFQNSLLAPIVYAHFLRQRYYQSAFSREAFGLAIGKLDSTIFGLNNPAVTGAYGKFKDLVARWGGSTIQPAPATPRQ